MELLIITSSISALVYWGYCIARYLDAKAEEESCR